MHGARGLNRETLYCTLSEEGNPRLDTLAAAILDAFGLRLAVEPQTGSAHEHATGGARGVICDQRIMLDGHYSAKRYPEYLRRIRFKDPESGKALTFLTNHTALPPLTIAALYKSRWQVGVVLQVD